MNKLSQEIRLKIENGARILAISETELVERAVFDYLSKRIIYPTSEEKLIVPRDEEAAPYNA